MYAIFFKHCLVSPRCSAAPALSCCWVHMSKCPFAPKGSALGLCLILIEAVAQAVIFSAASFPLNNFCTKLLQYSFFNFHSENERRFKTINLLSRQKQSCAICKIKSVVVDTTQCMWKQKQGRKRRAYASLITASITTREVPSEITPSNTVTGMGTKSVIAGEQTRRMLPLRAIAQRMIREQWGDV